MEYALVKVVKEDGNDMKGALRRTSKLRIDPTLTTHASYSFKILGQTKALFQTKQPCLLNGTKEHDY